MRAVIRFCFRLLLFALPLLALGGVVVGVAVSSGEAMPYAWMAALQAENPRAVFYQADMHYSSVVAYKREVMARRAPVSVLVVGSSRMLDFAEGVLDEPSRFYNFGVPGGYLDATETVITLIDPAAPPDVVVLGVDLFWFNADLPAAHATRESLVLPIYSLQTLTERTRAVVNWVAPQIRRARRIIDNNDPTGRSEAYGLVSIQTGLGFRFDGTLQYPARDPDAQPRTADDEIQRLNALRPGALLDANLNRLAALIDQLDSLGVTVVGVLPPYRADVYAALDASDQHAYFAPARAAVNEIFAQRGLPLFDFTDISVISGVGAGEMSDTVHSSAQLSARMFAQMVRAVPALRAHADPERIERAIAESPDAWQVFTRFELGSSVIKDEP